jgi:DDE superfamily endonuclease
MDALTSHSIYSVLVDFPTDNFPIPQRILSSNSFTPYFDGCIGALDGTHVPIHVPEVRRAAFRNRKGELSQNVLGVCTFDMQFLYVLAGWEGSASDSRIFEDALRKGFTIPKDRYYLADAGYANCDALLVPYRGVRYHLREWGIGHERCVYLIDLPLSRLY